MKTRKPVQKRKEKPIFPLPTPYELSRLILALADRKDPDSLGSASASAMQVWFAALLELKTVAESRLIGIVNRYQLSSEIVPDSHRHLVENPPSTLLSFGSSKSDSALMRWLNARAKNKKEKFRAFSALQKAWKSITGDSPPKNVSVFEAMAFLSRRKEVRRIADTEGKRLRRQRDGTTKKPRKKEAPRRSGVTIAEKTDKVSHPDN